MTYDYTNNKYDHHDIINMSLKVALNTHDPHTMEIGKGKSVPHLPWLKNKT